MMMANRRDATVDVLLHLDSSLVNSANGANPSASYNTNLLLYKTGKFDNGLSRTAGFNDDARLLYEYDIPYNGKHNFTIDFWVNTKSGSEYSCGVGIGKAYQTVDYDFIYNCDIFIKCGYPNAYLQPMIFTDGDSTPYSPSGFLTANVFNHIAVCYNYATNTMYIFINGNLTRTITSVLTHALTTTPIAFISVADSDVIIDEVRVSNVVRWTASFTPPTSPYTI